VVAINGQCGLSLTSSQKTAGYLPANDGAKAAFKDADIIVIPAGIPRAYTPWLSHSERKLTADQASLA